MVDVFNNVFPYHESENAMNKNLFFLWISSISQSNVLVVCEVF